MATIIINDDAAELQTMPDISEFTRNRIQELFDSINILGNITSASNEYARAGFFLRHSRSSGIESVPGTSLQTQARFLHESNLIEDISEISYGDVAQGLLEREASGCVGAWLYALELAENRRQISIDDICFMQKLVADEQIIHGYPLPDKYRGKIRDCLVRVGNYVHDIPTDEIMDQFIVGLELELRELDVGDLEAVLRFAARQHYDFELIHPFRDGNGRVGRLLVNYILVYCGYEPLIFTNHDKHRYYRGFVDASGVHEVDGAEMERYFIEQYMSQLGG